MTREEAIKYFKRHLDLYCVDGISREAEEMAIQALSQEHTDAISREYLKKIAQSEGAYGYVSAHDIATAPSVTQKPETVTEFADRCRECGARYGKLLKQKSGKWIPVSERLPEDTYPVNITWVNHDPEPYYADIKDKPFTATGCYCDGKWYWYSVTCQDYLDEYRYCDVDSMDEAIEIIAWMPLPEPYAPQESEE